MAHLGCPPLVRRHGATQVPLSWYVAASKVQTNGAASILCRTRPARRSCVRQDVEPLWLGRRFRLGEGLASPKPRTTPPLPCRGTMRRYGTRMSSRPSAGMSRTSRSVLLASRSHARAFQSPRLFLARHRGITRGSSSASPISDSRRNAGHVASGTLPTGLTPVRAKLPLRRSRVAPLRGCDLSGGRT